MGLPAPSLSAVLFSRFRLPSSRGRTPNISDGSMYGCGHLVGQELHGADVAVVHSCTLLMKAFYMASEYVGLTSASVGYMSSPSKKLPPANQQSM